MMQVTLFYTDCPTNPHLKCIDIKLVADLCHRRGALVCIDSTLASPINQKPLTLGADIVVHSATKYIAGHHDVSKHFCSQIIAPPFCYFISKISSCHSISGHRRMHQWL